MTRPPVSHALVFALACCALSGCRRREQPAGQKPAPSASIADASSRRALTLTLLRSAHAELLDMADKHEPEARQVEAATIILGEPHERAGGAARWFAWNAEEQPSAPKGCWVLSAGAERMIGMTARARCGR